MRLTFDENERDIQPDIKKALVARGWFCEKMELPARNGACDLLCLRRGRVALLEVKKPGEKPRPLQAEFIAEWKANGGEAYVVESVADALRHLA